MKFRQYIFCGAIPFTTHPPFFLEEEFFLGVDFPQLSVFDTDYTQYTTVLNRRKLCTINVDGFWTPNSNHDWIKSMIGTESIDCYYWVVFGGQGLSPSYPIIRWIEWYWVSGGWVGGYPLPLPCVWFLPVIRRWVGVIQTIRPHHQQGKVKSGHHLQLIKWEFTKTTYTVATSQWHCPIALQLHPTCGKSPKFL